MKKTQFEDLLSFSFGKENYNLDERNWFSQRAQELVEAYSEKERSYHDAEHIFSFCKELAKVHESKEINLNQLRNATFAALYHDFYFTLKANERSEAKSAEFAASVIVDWVENFGSCALNAHSVVRFILSTEFLSKIEDGIPDLERETVKLFKDCDLVCFRTPEELNLANERVCKEISSYFGVSEKNSKILRFQFLNSVLSSRDIFSSQYFQHLNKEIVKSIHLCSLYREMENEKI
jgi:predicted metal-dependent HD superfamily phosphohydrolase